jgi:hypothetical protein
MALIVRKAVTAIKTQRVASWALEWLP